MEAVSINNDELATAISQFNTNNASLTAQYNAALAAQSAFGQIEGGTTEN